jgi:thiol-disulfide isomerase/thioredoxin
MKAYYYIVAILIIVSSSYGQHTPLEILSLHATDNLIVLENDKFVAYDAKRLKSLEYVVFYYSAGWCPPCKVYTPGLADTYRKLRAKGKNNFEIIMTSWDKSDEALLDYFQKYKLPWPVLKREQNAINPIAGQNRNNSIPFGALASSQLKPVYYTRTEAGVVNLAAELEKIVK